MNNQDKKALESIANAVRILPDNKLEYLLGVADGMTAMAAAVAETTRSAERRDST